jgi:hypothetical protein
MTTIYRVEKINGRWHIHFDRNGRERHVWLPEGHNVRQCMMVIEAIMCGPWTTVENTSNIESVTKHAEAVQ